MRQFPLEILVFISLLIFSIFYLINVSAITDSQYLSLRHIPITKILKNYIFEFSILIFATLIYLTQKQKYIIFNSLLIGSFIFTLFIIFILKLSPITTQMENKTYYLILPYLINFFIIMSYIKNKKLYTFFFVFLCLSLILKNSQIYLKEEGKYYRQTSEYMLSQSEPVSIFISEYSEHLPWWNACWNSSYKYYAPHKQIKFATSAFNHALEDLLFLAFWNHDQQTYHPIEYKQLPQSGDFYIIKKTDKYADDLAVIQNIPHQLVYQNKLFEVYKIK